MRIIVSKTWFKYKCLSSIEITPIFVAIMWENVFLKINETHT